MNTDVSVERVAEVAGRLERELAEAIVAGLPPQTREPLISDP